MFLTELTPLVAGAVQEIENLLRGFFRPLEFTGEKEQSQGNQDKGRSRRHNHDYSRNEEDSADHRDDDLARQRRNLVESQKTSRLFHPLMDLLLGHKFFTQEL